MTDNETVEDEQWEVGVRFQRSGKAYSFASKGLVVHLGDEVLVRTEKGVDLGQVVEIGGRVLEEAAKGLMPVVRVATEEDLEHSRGQGKKEKSALATCAEKVGEHDLPMKLVDAHLSFDNTRLVFYFSADGRVDFRDLVRDLAKTFRKRIELRQIGVRDEAKLLGGIGPCGRRLCCKTFLRHFEPVGIRVAKDQGLALNPNKISGLCDRLMCCLRFEHKMYQELKASLPSKGDKVNTEGGPGRVTDVHLLKEELVVSLEDGREVRVAASEADVVEGRDEAPSRGPKPQAQAEKQPSNQSRKEEEKKPRSKQARRRRRRPRSERKQTQSGGRGDKKQSGGN